MKLINKLHDRYLKILYIISVLFFTSIESERLYAQQIPNVLDIQYSLGASPDTRPLNRSLRGGRQSEDNRAKVQAIYPSGNNHFSAAIGADQESNFRLLPTQEASSTSAVGPNQEGTGNETDEDRIARHDLREKRLQNINEKLEILYQILNLTDLAQTIYCLDEHKCQEGNPVFGHHPNNKVLIAAKALGGISHYVFYRKLNIPKTKLVFAIECLTIIEQGTVVGLNTRYSF